MLVDIHAKSSRSTGVKLSIDEVARRAAEVGLDGIAICDTLSSLHCKEALAACEKHGIAGFIGVEIPTDKGVLIGFVPDVDEFYLGEEWRQITDLATPSAEQVIALFRSKGGAVIAARPYDLEIPYSMGDLVFTLKDIQAVEVFNARIGRVQADFALEAARFMHVPTVGGSDPNGSAEDIGKFATFFEAGIATQGEFVNALLNSEFWAVQIGQPNIKKSSRTDLPKSDRDSGRGGDRGGRGGDRGGRGGDRGGRGGDRGGRGGDRGGRGGDRGGRGGDRGGRGGDRGGRGGDRGGRSGGGRSRR